jgi:hypothetical protein
MKKKSNFLWVRRRLCRQFIKKIPLGLSDYSVYPGLLRNNKTFKPEPGIKWRGLQWMQLNIYLFVVIKIGQPGMLI